MDDLKNGGIKIIMGVIVVVLLITFLGGMLTGGETEAPIYDIFYMGEIDNDSDFLNVVSLDETFLISLYNTDKIHSVIISLYNDDDIQTIPENQLYEILTATAFTFVKDFSTLIYDTEYNNMSMTHAGLNIFNYDFDTNTLQVSDESFYTPIMASWVSEYSINVYIVYQVN